MSKENMKFEQFAEDYWEDSWKSAQVLPMIDIKKEDDLHLTFKRFLPMGRCSLLEVGCAPGRWLAYFNRFYGYEISGIELVPEGAEFTKQNLMKTNSKADIICVDFLNYIQSDKYFDIVYSAGFIEHFENTMSIVNRLVSQIKPSGGYIVTTIPNLYGLNGWLSKTFRRRIYRGHVPISLATLINTHELCGIETIYANYYGGVRINAPMVNNRAAVKYPRISSLVNSPFQLINKLSLIVSKTFKIYPRISCFSSGLLYIGRKKS